MPRDLRNPVFKPSDKKEPDVIEIKERPDVVQSKAEIDMMIATANKFFRTSKTKKGTGSRVTDWWDFQNHSLVPVKSFRYSRSCNP